MDLYKHLLFLCKLPLYIYKYLCLVSAILFLTFKIVNQICSLGVQMTFFPSKMNGIKIKKQTVLLLTIFVLISLTRNVPLLPGLGNKTNQKNFLTFFFPFSSTLFQHSCCLLQQICWP